MEEIKAIGLPSLFQLFKKKIPFRHTIKKQQWVKYSKKALDELVDSNVGLYGTYKNPYFKALDLVRMCSIPTETMNRFCKKLNGKPNSYATCDTH